MRGLFVVVVLMATLVSQGTVQGQPRLTFGPTFTLSRYDGTEGADLSVHLSASVLTSIPINFGGSMEVDITAEDLPGGATFGTDYLVNLQNPLSRNFTVSFLPQQANSTENIIQLSNDNIFEGIESFGLRIVEARFSGQAAEIFRADDTLTNAFAQVNIADDDFVEINFTTSLPQEVREGDGVNVTLRGAAFGIYANPIEIGVICAPVDVGVPAAFPNEDFRFTPGTRLRFTDVDTIQSLSSNVVVVPIINDDIAEPCESLICTLQGGALDSVRGIEPNRVIIRICDDDELVVRWAKDFYTFGESDPATVQLVTDSEFELATVRIQGFPRYITAAPPRLPALTLCGPRVPGINFNASIELAEFREHVFGNAQVTEFGRTDVVNTFNDFVFTPTSKSALENFTIVNDSVLEFDEILFAEFDFGPEILSERWNVIKGEPSTAFILIRDDDSVEVYFNEESYTVAESAGHVSVSLRINGQYFVPVWAIVEIMDGTATDPEDYSSAVRYNVTFCQTAVTDTQTPARSTVSSPILINITDDDFFEGVEYFQARIVETSDRFRVRIGQDTVNVTITDDSVTVRYEQQKYTFQEEDGSVTLALVLGGEASVPVTVTVRTLDLLNSSYGDAATASVDYTPRGPFEITFPAGSTRQEYTVNIIDDFIPENSEFFNADIVSAGPEGVIIGEPRQPLIEIQDTVDEVVTVRYEQEQYNVEEEAGSVTLALVLDRAVPFNVTVIVNTLDLLDSSVGDAATANVDYTPRGPFEITFPAGSTRQEYTVNIIDDFIPENSEFFNADVTARPEDASIVAIGSPSQPLIEIQDLRDAVVAISLDRSAYSILENEEVVTVTLRLNDTYREDIEVNVAVGELLGIPDLERARGAGVDFSTDGFPTQVTIPAGQTSVQFNISVIDELLVERDERFQVSFTYSGGQPGVVMGPDFDEANITIENDDALIVRFERDSYSVREDDGSLLYGVIATGNASFAYDVVITGADGSATCGSDYHDIDDSSGTDPPVMSCSYSLTITIPAGSSAGDGVVAIINDAIYEGTENFFLDLSVAQTFQVDGINEGSPLRATVEIEDDDALVAISLDRAAYSIVENEQVVTVTLTLNDTYQEDIVVNVAVGELLGIPDAFRALGAGVDFSTEGFPGQVTIPAGQTSIQFNISVRDDLIVERDELFQVSFTYSGSQPGVVVNPDFDEANITIRNDDALIVMFERDSYSVREDAGSLMYTVIATSTASFDYQVVITGADGSATCGSDYHEPIDDSSRSNPPVMSCSYSLTIPIPAGSSAGDGVVAIINDTIYEGTENFFLDLSVAQTFQDDGINEGSPLRATVQIEDDDELRVFFDPAAYSVPEGENQVLVLRTDNEFAVPFTIDVTLRNGTAVAPADYEDRSYQVVFNVTTQMGTRVVFTETDIIIENDEDFTAVLSVPSGLPHVFEGIPSEANVTILDRATAEVYLDHATYSVTEGQSADLILRLTRDVDPTVTIIVRVQTMDGLATDGADYTGGLDTATFRGSSTTSVPVPTLSDNVLEGLEYFTGVIQVPPETTTNYRVTAGSPDTATVNIIDATIAEVYFDPDVYMVNEGDSVTLILKTNVTVNKRFSVLVNTHDDSANSPADYRGGERRVIFAIGSSMATVEYSTVNDGTREGNESFIAELTVPPEMQAMGIVHGMPDRTTVNVIDDKDDLSHDKTALCPTAKDSVWGIQWLAIAAGSIQLAHCPGEGSSSVDGLAYRRCLAGVPAEWGSVDASECESVAVRAVREKTDEFVSSLKKSNGTNRDLTDKERKVFQNISQGLNAVLDPSDERNRSIVPQDLKTAVKFVEVVANLGENNGLFREESNETEKTVADILSNVLDERNAPAFEATAQTDSTDPEQDKAETPAVSILQSTERVANVIATTLSKTKPFFTIARPNLAISGQRFSFDNLRTSIVFPGPGIRDTLTSFRNRESLPQIRLPQSFLRAAKGIETSLEDDTVEVVNVVMNNMENYLPSDVIKQDKKAEDEPEETFPASRVISSQILGYNGGEVDTKERVEVTFPVNVKPQSLPVPPGKVKQFRCAFFNFEAEEGNQTGRWSYSGVETHVINSTHVRCIASHLTSFAVLVSIIPSVGEPSVGEPSVGEPPALDYISYIGCSISLLCLLASIIFYLTLRKELIKKLHNFVHLNLCIALSLGLLFFLTGIQTATANIYACKFMTALLHYFFLATFTWTLCEAVLVYILLVKVFGANERKWIYLYLALGWVLPIPIVVITGGARHDYYLIRASFDQSHPHYNSIKACWLPTENGVIFAFIGPMVAIILVNAVLLTISLVSLARSQCGRVSSKNDEKRQKYMEVGKQLLKTTIILVPLLGFTWIIGLFAVGEEGKAFAYLFVIANVFQGLFIFVLHVLRHEKVYGKIKGKLPNISKLVTAYTGSTSSSAKSTHASTSDTRKVSFVLESEAIIESGVNKDEDAESIKDGGNQDVRLDVIKENVQDGEGNECEESHAVATTALEMSAGTTSALEETEEKAKGDSTEDHAGQTCAEFTSKEQSDNEAGGVMDTVC